MTRQSVILALYRLFKVAGLTDAAIFAMLGNWDCESGLEAGRLQGDFNPFRTSSKNYVRKVTNKEISRLQFSSDLKGFGLAQWTYWNNITKQGRKMNLYDFWQASGDALDDPLMQGRFAIYELQNEHKDLYKLLTTSNDINECSDKICLVYERPQVNNFGDRRNAANRIKKEFDIDGVTPPVEEKKSEFHPPRMICRGMVGADIIVLQAIFLAMGLVETEPDGVFSSSLEQVVREFQKNNACDVDGIVGQQTWGKLKQVYFKEM